MHRYGYLSTRWVRRDISRSRSAAHTSRMVAGFAIVGRMGGDVAVAEWRCSAEEGMKGAAWAENGRSGDCRWVDRRPCVAASEVDVAVLTLPGAPLTDDTCVVVVVTVCVVDVVVVEWGRVPISDKVVLADVGAKADLADGTANASAWIPPGSRPSGSSSSRDNVISVQTARWLVPQQQQRVQMFLSQSSRNSRASTVKSSGLAHARVRSQPTPDRPRAPALTPALVKPPATPTHASGSDVTIT